MKKLIQFLIDQVVYFPYWKTKPAIDAFLKHMEEKNKCDSHSSL